jgi:Fe-Mn family superoxide dismutase
MKHTLPPLPYYHASLEPHIDARTMTLHHDKHHASYVDNLNTALEKYPDLHERTATWLVANPERIPEEARAFIRNNAGGHVNHSLLWRAMSPGEYREPTGALADAIKRDFGGLDAFKARFDEAGAKLFGSGWVWLARARREDGKLQICTTAGHDNPLAQGRFPILVNDVWEHAYYLKHENRRGDYLKGWWPVVNWEEAARRFDRAKHSVGRDAESEDDSLLMVAA